MKLTKQELTALQDMIKKTSTLVLNKLKNIDNSDKDILFLGDSLVEYFQVESNLNINNASNRGIAGATTHLINENFDLIVGSIDPKKIFLSVGSNNLVLNEETPIIAAANIIKLITRLHETYPFSTIYYLSTTPVVSIDSKIYKRVYVAGRTNEENKEINKQVSTFMNNDQLVFINQFDSLIDNQGYLIEELTPDGIHLNKNGYLIYAKNIKPFLNETCE